MADEPVVFMFKPPGDLLWTMLEFKTVDDMPFKCPVDLAGLSACRAPLKLHSEVEFRIRAHRIYYTY